MLNQWKLEKVISGGQTGADLAGTQAASLLSIETGGWMPKGFKNLPGFHPEYSLCLGMEETESADYAPRTRLNVRNSDATIRFATNWVSPGERYTFQCIKEERKPHLDAVGCMELAVSNEEKIQKIVAWLNHVKPKVLNIAGNSEKTSPGIGDYTYFLLADVFTRVLLTQRGLPSDKVEGRG